MLCARVGRRRWPARFNRGKSAVRKRCVLLNLLSELKWLFSNHESQFRYVGHLRRLSRPGPRRKFSLQRRAQHRARATWRSICDGIRLGTTRRPTPPRTTPRCRRFRHLPAYIFRRDPPLGSYLQSFSGAAPTFPLFPFFLAGRPNLTIYMFVLRKASRASHICELDRIRRMRDSLFQPPSTASRPARHGILRYGSGVRVEVRKGVDRAIPGAVSCLFGSLVSSCHLNVSSSP